MYWSIWELLKFLNKKRLKLKWKQVLFYSLEKLIEISKLLTQTLYSRDISYHLSIKENSYTISYQAFNFTVRTSSKLRSYVYVHSHTSAHNFVSQLWTVNKRSNFPLSVAAQSIFINFIISFQQPDEFIEYLWNSLWIKYIETSKCVSVSQMTQHHETNRTATSAARLIWWNNQWKTAKIELVKIIIFGNE